MTTLDAASALVLLSGGQDSTTCLAWALDRFERVDTIGFNYGQRHVVELGVRGPILERIRACFPEWSDRVGQDLVIPLDLSAAESALLSDAPLEVRDDGLPNTFVPGRNLLFLMYAAVVAYRRGIKNIVIGCCETDFSGYPDCRDDVIKALQVTLNIGMQTRFILHTPLMLIDKAATWRLAEKLGGARFVDLVREETHTCYLGTRDKRHEWGYGCASCEACRIRANGWRAFSERNEKAPLRQIKTAS